MNKYKAFLFDMDGTLVSSEKLKGSAIVKACSHFGGEVDINIYKEVMGESWKVVTNHFFNIARISPNMDEFNIEFNRIYKRLLQKELKLTPNAKEFIFELSKKGKKIGVVSSGSAWMVNQILEQFHLFDIFNIVITNENVMHHKPHPEAYLLAFKKMSLDSSEVLIFEDSSAGLQAAKGANCDVIAVAHEFNTNNDLSLALKVITDFGEVMKNMFNHE